MHSGACRDFELHDSPQLYDFQLGAVLIVILSIRICSLLQQPYVFGLGNLLLSRFAMRARDSPIGKVRGATNFYAASFDAANFDAANV